MQIIYITEPSNKYMKKPTLTDKEKEIFEMLKENNLYDEILNLGYLCGREEMLKEVIQLKK